MSWEYGQLAAEVYDLDKPIGHSFGDVEYYREHLSGVEGRVLEPAVGTGRMLVPLLEAGCTVDGTDVSPEMLERCKANCRAYGLDPVLHQADMTSYVETAAYEAVILPAGSIVLLDRDAAARALRCFRDCLRPGGRLILDLDPPQAVEQPIALASLRNWRSGDELWTIRTDHLEHDALANRVTRWLRYEKWRDGRLVATELQIFALQLWSLPEFTRLVTDSGFTDVTVTADYRTDARPSADSHVWTVHATRAG